MRKVFFDKIDYVDVATGTFVNRNHLADYLEMMLAIGIGVMIASLQTSPSKTRRLLKSPLGLQIPANFALFVILLPSPWLRTQPH